jgi:hypothetical protein
MKSVEQYIFRGCTFGITDVIYEVHRWDGLKWHDTHTHARAHTPSHMTIGYSVSIIDEKDLRYSLRHWDGLTSIKQA